MNPFKKKKTLATLPFREFRTLYTKSQISMIDSLFDMMMQLGGGDRDLFGAIFKEGAISSVVDPAYIQPLYGCEYLWSVVAGYCSDKFGTISGHTLNKDRVATLLDLNKYFSKHDMPFWVLSEAALMYAPLIQKDFEVYQGHIREIEERTFPKKKLSAAIQRAMSS